MPSELLARLVPWLDETPAAQVMSPAGQAGWPAGNFGQVMAEVRSIVAHLTAGWPRRDAADNFVERFTVPGTPRRGLGTQFYISQDGTVARLIDLPRRTGHAEFVNSWALGVETGNLSDVADPPSVQWIAASANAEDIPGAKLWITSDRPVQTEVLPCWWTTAGYAGPGRGVIGPGHMLFAEWQYRAWAVLLRYLFEDGRLPRNFPLLPHELRSGTMMNSLPFRRIVLADERAEMMRRAFAALAPHSIQVVNFEPGNEAALQAEYVATVAPAAGNLKQHNRAWRAFFNVYRGVHGHGFSGAIVAGNHDHDCPGPLFDFHRLARSVWDWWWYPFDTDGWATAVPRRGYRRFDATTPVLEYYYDEGELSRMLHVALPGGIHGPQSSPLTFWLDAGSPIYALANGELVAARFPPPGDRVSLAFVLVRHEVYHLPNFGNVLADLFGMPAPLPGAANYDHPPSFVYSLYMHLGRTAGMSFDDVHDDNPDWLNRVLVRKKECDLGVAFHDDDPAHHGIDAAVWNSRPPGVPQRPTTLEGWRIDQEELGRFLNNLRAGDVAVKTHVPGSQPIAILLGDFLGESGIIRREGGVSTHGIRVEVFSPSFAAPTFSQVNSPTGWTVPPGTPAPHCIFYQSEWARGPTDAERAALEAIGVDTTLLGWWLIVALGHALDRSLPADARLPFSGEVHHYHPMDFMRWINAITWRNEWPKYQVLDAGGQPVVAAPPRPVSRRV